MLVLTRKSLEEIQITDGKSVIDITIVEVRQNSVKVGISAPDAFKVLRGELVGTQIDVEG